MTARLRSSLHPLTVASIGMQPDGCCGPLGQPDDRLWLCEYHMGFEDGIDQLLDEQEELGGRWKADADRLASRLNLANAIFGDGSPRWQEANKKALDLHDKEVKSDG